MNISKEAIKKNSTILYSRMKRMYHYTFEELDRLLNLGSTELCLALIQLLQERKIEQCKDAAGIRYTMV